MTDSESEIVNPNVFTFQNVNTTVSARGPNTNITNFSFRNRMTSSMYLPRNFERQRYAESVSDQRSIYYRRETSPMSIQSAFDIRPRNFQQSYHGTGPQSVFNGRGASPVSMRSIDSCASISATDIVFALNNNKYNRHGLKVIERALQKRMRQRIQKRREKRRNLRLFLKSNKDRDDFEDQGSESSLSSDDCRSIKTSYKDNMSSSRSARIDLTDFRQTVRDSTMVMDSTENFRQNIPKNMFSASTTNFTRNNFNISSVSKQSLSIPTQKDRFKNGFLLPSQRFNRSVASSVIPEISERHHKNIETSYRQNKRINCPVNRQVENQNCESASEEEIFSEMSVREDDFHNIEQHRKRNLDSDDDDTSRPERKKSRISSPVKYTQINGKVPPKIKHISPVKDNNVNSNNFEFAKPALPVKKPKAKVQEKVIAHSKLPVEEKVIAKSKQPLTGFVEIIPNKPANNSEIVQPTISQEKQCDNQPAVDNLESTQNSDVSMRPSFIKRKLFTQKLDVAEKANISNDGMNSPQCNGYSGLLKEKNKARKLVTSQSCLNREVQDDNNLLDLIHKIVPPDRINITNQSTINHTKMDGNHSNKKDDDDRWDVTSVISMCNENDVSDTFTDEEIFANDTKQKDSKTKAKENINHIANTNSTSNTETVKHIKENHDVPKECRILVEKIHNIQHLRKPVRNQIPNLISADVSKSVVKTSAKTFWDTDFESDAECQVTTQKSYIKENQTRGNVATKVSSPEFKFPNPRSPISKNHQVPETSRWLNNTKNTTIMNNTLDSTRKFNISTLSVKTHRTSKKKKCLSETCCQEIAPTKSVIVVKNTSKPETKAKKSKPETIAKSISKTETNSISATKPKTKSNSQPQINSISQPVVELNKTSIAKTEVQINTCTKKSNPKSNSKCANKSISTSQTRKSPNRIRESPKKPVSRSRIRESPKDSRSASRVEKSPKYSRSTSRTRKSVKKPVSRSRIRESPKDSRSTSRAQKSPKKSRSTSRTRESPKKSVSTSRARKSTTGTKTMDMKIQSPKNSHESQNNRTIRSRRTRSQTRSMENSRSSRQFDISPLVISHRMSKKRPCNIDVSLEPEIKKNVTSKRSQASNETNQTSIAKKPKIQNMNNSIASLCTRKSPRKAKSKISKQISKNITNYESPRSGRPIRTCRTPSQNRSIENYKSAVKGR